MVLGGKEDGKGIWRQLEGYLGLKPDKARVCLGPLMKHKTLLSLKSSLLPLPCFIFLYFFFMYHTSHNAGPDTQSVGIFEVCAE